MYLMAIHALVTGFTPKCFQFQTFPEANSDGATIT